LRPDDEPTNWNIGIAATALREWRTAREAWRRAGIEMEDGDAPITGKFGFTPVRLNGFDGAEGSTEVVWAHRLSPVTARISNIPTPEARFRFGDVVLHDGAATGTRFYAPGDERPVFNVLELFEPSDLATYEVNLQAPDSQAIDALATACDASGIEFEDWTAHLQYLCKACSEGRAHEQHDHSIEDQAWQVKRRVGLASKDPVKVQEVLEQWRTAEVSRRIESVEA